MTSQLSRPSRPRVAVYFDGLNVMFRLRESAWEEFFDVGYAARRIAGNRQLQGVYYFSARPAIPPIKTERQYWNEVQHLDRAERQLWGEFGRKVRYGYMASRSYGWEEKKTDVWLAAQMVADALTDVYDVGILVTADADLAPVPQMLGYFDKGSELVVFPRAKQRNMSELVRSVNSIRTARKSWFRPYG